MELVLFTAGVIFTLGTDMVVYALPQDADPLTMIILFQPYFPPHLVVYARKILDQNSDHKIKTVCLMRPNANCSNKDIKG